MPLHITCPCCQRGRYGCKPSNQAERRKTEKYAHLRASHHFVPFAIETSGVFGPEALFLLEDMSRRIRAETGEPQQGNAASVLGTAHVIDNVFIYLIHDLL